MSQPRVLVVIHELTQRICPVLADTQEQAWALVSQELGYDVTGYPVFDPDDDDDLASIIEHIRAHTGGDH